MQPWVLEVLPNVRDSHGSSGAEETWGNGLFYPRLNLRAAPLNFRASSGDASRRPRSRPPVRVSRARWP